MPVIAIVNRKGGSGKSTLATHLAARYASAGISVMLGDVDLQQSTQTWLRLRAQRPQPSTVAVVGWAVDPRRVLRPPPGVQHVVLDTPGGLRGFDLARVAAFADVILMPVCNSIFDRESTAECHAELLALPRVASGRCKVAAVGMRLDSRTRAVEVLQAWAAALGLPFIGVLRESQCYVRWIEQGSSLFDQPAARFEADLLQWQPILEWLDAAVLSLRHSTRAAAGAASLRHAAAAAPLSRSAGVASLLGAADAASLLDEKDAASLSRNSEVAVLSTRSGPRMPVSPAGRPPRLPRSGSSARSGAEAMAQPGAAAPAPAQSQPGAAAEPGSPPARSALPVLHNLRMMVAGLVGRLGGPGFAPRNP